MAVAEISPAIIQEMVFFYSCTIISFLAGCSLAWLGWEALKSKYPTVVQPINHTWHDHQSILSGWKKMIILSVCCALTIAKILLIKEGVYSSYAFDSGAMESKLWRVSMGLSEMAVIFFGFSLAAKHWRIAGVLLFCISINLLHGTRIYFMIAAFMIMYERIYLSKAITFGRAILLSVFVGVALLFAFLAVFFHRSGVSYSLRDLDFETIISPIVYESIFNQISFVRMLKIHIYEAVNADVARLFYDIAVFRMPKFLTEGVVLHTNEFGELSPLGGMSGFATALIYFGSLYPLIYFFMGFSLCFLWKYSELNRSVILKTIFLYILCSTFFRSFRDPWVVPSKMLFDNLIALLMFFGISSLLRPLRLVWLRKKPTVDNVNS